MRSILISIKPEWTAKILNGEKTIEVRKTAPKCELPIEVYIYCTKGKYLFAPNGLNEHWWVQKYFGGEGEYNKKIVAKFTLKAVHKFDWRLVANPFFKVRGSCLGYDQLRKYATDKKGVVHDLYGWCISDLEIFDEPKKLEEFYSAPKKINGLYGAEMVNISLSNPPQSWSFIEVEETK